MKKLILALLLVSCAKDDPTPAKLPVVQTSAEKTIYGVVVKIKVIGSVTKNGFCWSPTQSPPSVGVNPVNKLTDTLQLSPGKYYFRGFAYNSAGLAYGNVVTLQW